MSQSETMWNIVEAYKNGVELDEVLQVYCTTMEMCESVLDSIWKEKEKA